MYYAIYSPDNETSADELVFQHIKDAHEALKKLTGSRMKCFSTREQALEFVKNGEEEKFYDCLESLEKSFGSLSLEPGPTYPSVQPALLNKLRRNIEAGSYEEVEVIVWSNPRSLITCCDSAVYLMSGPKYNACHIAARANKPDIIAMILKTISNFTYIRMLYPNEPDSNIQDRANHLLDSYLNTPDPRQGNTPLHFACKLGYYKVVRVLLTFEGCDLSLRDSQGQTAEESICDDPTIKKKIKNLFKHQLHMPLFRDQLKKRLLMERRISSAGSDTSFSDFDDSFVLNKSSI